MALTKVTEGVRTLGTGEVTTADMATDPTNATNLASGTVPTSRLGSGTASSSTYLTGAQTYVAVDLTGITSNADDIALLGFKVAANGSLARYNLVDQSIDAFEDASGVDASASTNEVRNSSNYYSGETDDTSTLLLIHSDTTNGSTTFTDSSSYARTITAGGSITHSTAASPVSPDSDLGGTSIAFDGSAKFLSIAPYSAWMPTGEFTFEAWFWQSAGGYSLYDTWASTWHDSNRTGFNLWVGEDSGRNAFWEAEYGSTEVVVGTGVSEAGDTSYTNNAWHHYAVSRDSSNVIRVFIDGTQDGTGTQAGTLSGTSGYDLTLGSRPVGSTRRWWDGYLTEIRWSDVCRYTTNFTAPTEKFTAKDPADLTLVSNTLTSVDAVTKGDMVMTYTDGIGTATLNTDLKGYISRDNGANYTELTLASQGTTGGHTIVTAHDVTLGGTDTSQMRWKVTTHNQSASKETRIQAVSLGWS